MVSSYIYYTTFSAFTHGWREVAGIPVPGGNTETEVAIFVGEFMLNYYTKGQVYKTKEHLL